MRSFARSIGLITGTTFVAGAIIFSGLGCEGADVPPAPNLGEQGDYVEPDPIEIVSFTPARALPSDEIFITGTGFNASVDLTLVRIGGAGALVTAATESTLTAIVPVFAGSGEITVEDRWGLREDTTAEQLEIAVPLGLAMGASGDTGAPVVGLDGNQSITLPAGATTHSMAGDVTGAGDTGYWLILDDAGAVRSAGVLPQSGDRYAQTLPMFCGTQGMTVFYDNESGRGFQRFEVTRVSCTEPGVRIKLSWDTDESDVDLHLLQPGGAYATSPGDCYYANRNPDWGVEGDPDDDPELDVDDTTGYGPENIYLDPTDPGSYRAIVHYFSDDGVGPSDAWLEVFIDGARVSSFGPFTLQNTGAQWPVCTIEWPDGTVAPTF